MIASAFHQQASEPTAPQSDRGGREVRLLRAALVLTLVLTCVWALSLNLVDPDLWGHVLYAEELISAGELPHTATHTFSAADHPWVNHENLAELALALGYRHLGTSGLLAAKSILGLGILLAMVWVARQSGVQPVAAWSLMLLIAACLHPFFILRPQLFSFVLCALVLVLLERAFREWQTSCAIHWRPLCCLPLIFAVWSNTHGAFVAGLAISGAYLAGRAVESLLSRPNSHRQVIPMLSLALGCVVITLANPYGLELHRWLLSSLSQPRPEITEWGSAGSQHIVFWPWVALLTTTVLSLLFTREKRDWVKIVILALVAWQSALHMRHIAFLALLCGFWLPVHAKSAASRVRLQFEPKGWMRRCAFVASLPCIGWLSLSIDRQLTSLPVSRNAYPLDAVQFMADRGLQGKLVVAFNWAQYAVAALPQEIEVAFDGRFRTCYPQEVVDMHFDFLLGEFGGRRSRSPDSGEIDGSRVLDHGLPDLVLLDRRYENPVAIMQNASAKSEWVLLFRDRISEIWGRSQRYDDPLKPDYFPPALRVQDPRPRDGNVEWPAIPVRDDASHLVRRHPTQGSVELEL